MLKDEADPALMDRRRRLITAIDENPPLVGSTKRRSAAEVSFSPNGGPKQG